MKVISFPPKTPAGRLHWITRYSPPYRREVHGPRYLILLAFVAVLLLIVFLGIAIGSAAAEFFTLYSSWLRSLASPLRGSPVTG